jgi:hypothetical protein
MDPNEKRRIANADTKATFVIKGKLAHPDTKYDFRKVVYVNARRKVIIGCPKCKKYFERTPDKFINQHLGCPDCTGKSRANSKTITFQIFEVFARLAHGFRYKYKKNTYKKYNRPMIMTCMIHGDFQLLPKTHLQGSGCRKCGINGKGIKVVVDTTKDKLSHSDMEMIISKLEEKMTQLESKNN